MKIYQVTSVSVTIHSENPATLIIQALGLVSSTGWTDPRLDPSGDANPADGVFEYSFEANPPGGVALQVLTPVAATFVAKPERPVDAVVVSGRTNAITVHASEFVAGATARAVVPQRLTTLIAGEEGSTTLRLGEEHLTTMVFGEEGATTLRLGEEGPSTDPRLDDPASPLGGPFGAL